MKKNIRLFINNNEESIKCAEIAKKKFREKVLKL